MFFNTIVRAANGPKLYWELTLLKKPSPDLLLNVRAEPSSDRLIKILNFWNLKFTEAWVHQQILIPSGDTRSSLQSSVEVVEAPESVIIWRKRAVRWIYYVLLNWGLWKWINAINDYFNWASTMRKRISAMNFLPSELMSALLHPWEICPASKTYA